MQRNPKSRGVVGTAMLVAALAVLALAPSAQAKLTGEFTKFQYCPTPRPASPAAFTR